MTVFKKEYYQEIIEQELREDMYVQHYTLVAENETILYRLDKRTQENNNWALKHLDNCLQAFEDQIPGWKIDTGGLRPDEVAASINKESIR